LLIINCYFLFEVPGEPLFFYFAYIFNKRLNIGIIENQCFVLFVKEIEIK